MRYLYVLGLVALWALLVVPAALADGTDTPGDLNNLQNWSLLVGAVLPWLVSVVQQPQWPDWARAVVAFGSSALAAAVTVWLASDWDSGDFVGSLLRVFIAAQATYLAFWKPTGIAPATEAATSGVSRAEYARRRLAAQRQDA